MNKFSSSPPTTPKTPQEFLGGASMGAINAPESPPSSNVTSPEASATPQDDQSVYRTLTLRLNKKRYKRLKMLSTLAEQPIQTILTEALDDYIQKKDAQLA